MKNLLGVCSCLTFSLIFDKVRALHNGFGNRSRMLLEFHRRSKSIAPNYAFEISTILHLIKFNRNSARIASSSQPQADNYLHANWHFQEEFIFIKMDDIEICAHTHTN
jgi:hypothetical protein